MPCKAAPTAAPWILCTWRTSIWWSGSYSTNSAHLPSGADNICSQNLSCCPGSTTLHHMLCFPDEHLPGHGPHHYSARLPSWADKISFSCTEICFLNFSGDCIDDLPARSTIWPLGWTTTTQHSGYPATQGTPNIPPVTKNHQVPHVEPNPSYHPLELDLPVSGIISTEHQWLHHHQGQQRYQHLSSFVILFVCCWCLFGGGRNDSAPPPHIFYSLVVVFNVCNLVCQWLLNASSHTIHVARVHTYTTTLPATGAC